MTKDEFIKTACSLGYCNKKQAEEYCEDRETFTDDDFIGVYRSTQKLDLMRGHVYGRNGAKTSKRYLHNGGSEGNR